MKKSVLATILTIGLAGAGSMLLAGCEGQSEDGTFEQMGEDMDQAAEEAGETMREGTGGGG